MGSEKHLLQLTVLRELLNPGCNPQSRTLESADGWRQEPGPGETAPVSASLAPSQRSERVLHEASAPGQHQGGHQLQLW